MSWFNNKQTREELRQLREVADRVQAMAERVAPGWRHAHPITAVAMLEVWLTDTLFEKARK